MLGCALTLKYVWGFLGGGGAASVAWHAQTREESDILRHALILAAPL